MVTGTDANIPIAWTNNILDCAVVPSFNISILNILFHALEDEEDGQVTF